MPDIGAMVSFEVDGSSVQTINAKHPSQTGSITGSPNIRFRTKISGYQREEGKREWRRGYKGREFWVQSLVQRS